MTARRILGGLIVGLAVSAAGCTVATPLETDPEVRFPFAPPTDTAEFVPPPGMPMP